jgi:hypothetical protein
MRTRGRNSAAAKAAPVVINGSFGQRPEPPAELNECQAEIWRGIVASEDPKFFATAVLRNLLADYCRHREAIAKVNEMVDGFDPDWLRQSDGLSRYRTLLKIREAETRASVSLATKLRMTNQARFTAKAAGAGAARVWHGPKPWEM